MKDEKIVLTLSSDYLGHWTIYDALRELYQNIFDREQEDEEAEWFSNAVKNQNGIHLSMGNANTILDRKTLILGVTSKKDDKHAIGKFGEGYKLAMLVLLREGINVHIKTGNEKWTFSFEHAPQFGMKMLTVTISLLPKAKQTTDLVFSIDGIKSKTWSAYSQYNLNLQKKLKFIETPKCEVLTDKRNRSKIFVGGLYVCKYIGASIYGYNFHPDVFPLGRDRNIIEGFSANWEASRALADASIKDIEVMHRVVDNLSKGDDSQYVSSFANSADVLTDALWNKYITTYPNTLPVDGEWRKKSLLKEYLNVKVSIVTTREYEILIKSRGYKEAKKALESRPPAPTPEEVVNKFYDDHVDEMSKDLMTVYASELMTEAVNWKLEE